MFLPSIRNITPRPKKDMYLPVKRVPKMLNIFSERDNWFVRRQSSGPKWMILWGSSVRSIMEHVFQEE